MSVHSSFDIDAILDAMGGIEFGVIEWFDAEQGIGSVAQDDGGPAIIILASEIVGVPVRAPKAGQRVSYRVGGTPDRPHAEAVHLL